MDRVQIIWGKLGRVGLLLQTLAHAGCLRELEKPAMACFVFGFRRCGVGSKRIPVPSLGHAESDRLNSGGEGEGRQRLQLRL